MQVSNILRKFVHQFTVKQHHMASYSVFKTLNPKTNQWEAVDIPPAPKGGLDDYTLCSIHKYGNNPFIFAVQQWFDENKQPLVYIAAKVTYDYDCHFWHPEHGYQKGRVMVEVDGEDVFENFPEWVEKDLGWY